MVDAWYRLLCRLIGTGWYRLLVQLLTVVGTG
jgi:hypothetical protein